MSLNKKAKAEAWVVELRMLSLKVSRDLSHNWPRYRNLSLPSMLSVDKIDNGQIFFVI